MPYETFEELVEDSQNFVNFAKKKGAFNGIRKLLTELYPDTAHFVYELLQNADDAKATAVSFSIFVDHLEFEHNGTVLFELKDVEAITNIGEGTKADDPTTIGKFGVGFKAVFAYTDTPKIESGDFHFHIENVLVPVRETQLSRKDKMTRFEFPFDHRDKKPENAFEEIKKQLTELPDDTLLFLKHIDSIDIKINSDKCRIKRSMDNGVVKIASTGRDKDYFSRYFRIEKDIKIEDAEDGGKEKNLRIAVAFVLSESDNPVIISDDGKVLIFFPCVKESSGLKFHIHAPFASTVARDSVRETDANKKLMNAIAELVADSIDTVKSRGWLTTDFLEVLPNSNDNLSPFYKSIYDAVIEKFKSGEYVPLKNDGYDKPENCYRTYEKRSPEKIDELVSLKGKEWTCETETRGSQFFRDLGIVQYGTKDFITSLRQSRNHDFITSQPVDWLQRFYILLDDWSNMNSHKNEDLKPLRIVRTQDGKFDTGNRCYFVSKDGKKESGWQYIDTRLLKTVNGNEKDKSDENPIRKFLKEKLGVRSICLEERVKKILLGCYQKDNLRPQDNIQNIKLFIRYVDKDKQGSEPFADLSIFNGKYFLKLTNGEWAMPNQVYVDSDDESSPLHTGLFAYYEQVKDGNKFRLDENFYNDIPVDDFRMFLEKVGVKTHIVIDDFADKSGQGWYDGRYGNFRTVLANDAFKSIQWNTNISILLWVSLNKCKSIDDYFAKYYCYVKYANYPIGDTDFVLQLRSTAWIPQKQDNGDCEFVKPSDAVQRLLPDGFVFDNGKGWIQRIEFGKVTKAKAEEAARRKEETERLVALSDEQRQQEERRRKEVLYKEGITDTKRDFCQKYTEEEMAKMERLFEEDERKEQEKYNTDETAERNPDTYIEPENAPVRIGKLLPSVLPSNTPITKAKQEHDKPNEIEKPPKKKQSQKRKYEIGEWGEQYVMKLLREEFKDDASVIVERCNKTTETQETIQSGFDIAVKKNGEVIRYVEVKSTTSPLLADGNGFETTGTQWETARHEGDKYWYYVVLNAESKEAFSILIQNPIKKWKDGKLVADPVVFRLSCTSENVSNIG
ncbi:MAG: DUF3883 domain-containing protein [Planctomycetaceae bacterium]|jgi:hypothetical protein|nr:DUF3883 domain-containing protein [Planctomycetaceae bacterium]